MRVYKIKQTISYFGHSADIKPVETFMGKAFLDKKEGYHHLPSSCYDIINGTYTTYTLVEEDVDTDISNEINTK